RPAVEAAIFAYRIFERKELGKVWVQRQEDFKTFSKEFRFAPLPERMPNREALDQYLDGLNDYRSHPNILYLAGWFEKTDGRLQLNYFDMEKVCWPALFAFISTAIRVIEVFRAVFSSDAKIFLADSEAEFTSFKVEFEKLRKKYEPKLAESLRAG